MKSPMKMNYSGTAPKGIPALSKGSSQTGPKVMKGARAAGEKYKKPSGGSTRLGRASDDKSSANVTMKPQSASDKNRYRQAVQPEQYSNSGTAKKTKFVC